MVQHITAAKMRIGARTVIIRGVIPGITGTGQTVDMPAPRRGIARAVLRAMKAAVGALARRRRERKTARTLGALDDDMLKDLGLSRSDTRALRGKDDIRNWRTINRWR